MFSVQPVVANCSAEAQRLALRFGIPAWSSSGHAICRLPACALPGKWLGPQSASGDSSRACTGGYYVADRLIQRVQLSDMSHPVLWLMQTLFLLSAHRCSSFQARRRSFEMWFPIPTIQPRRILIFLYVAKQPRQSAGALELSDAREALPRSWPTSSAHQWWICCAGVNSSFAALLFYRNHAAHQLRKQASAFPLKTSPLPGGSDCVGCYFHLRFQPAAQGHDLYHHRYRIGAASLDCPPCAVSDDFLWRLSSPGSRLFFLTSPRYVAGFLTVDYPCWY